jgi:transposase
MELKALRRLGWTVSAMAREFGLSRTTIYKELASNGTRRYGPRPRPMALNEAQAVHVERRLVVCPGIRGTDLHAELRSAYGYEGSYPAFERQLRWLRPAVVRDPEIRFETAPGIQTQGDWAHMGLWPLGDRMVELYAMVAILGFSRAPAIRFATDLTRPTSLRALVRCFDDLGGVTREALTDRDPAFCIGATRDGSAILAPDWVDLCAQLGVVPAPAVRTVPRPRARWSAWFGSSRKASSPGSLVSCSRRRRASTPMTSWPNAGSRCEC